MANSNTLFPVKKKCLYPSQQVATDTVTGQFVYEFWMRDDIESAFEIYIPRYNRVTVIEWQGATIESFEKIRAGRM